MKTPVLQRAMFVAVAPKSESKGILSGFDEEMENEDYEDRTPENIEIIANNLRGDIRSMDERYLELAQLVGEAAFDTPEEVVALMQSQMAQQGTPDQASGVASLGAPAMPTNPQGIMQGVAQAEEQPQQPVQMAAGGIVHRQFGSPPGGERAQQVNMMRQNIANMMIAPGGPARAMGDLYQQQSPFLTRMSQQAFQPVSQLAGRGVNMLNAARPVYNALGPYGRGGALLTAGALPILGYMAGQEPPSEGGPVFSEVPGVDAQGRYQPVLRSVENMPGTREEKTAVRSMGFSDLGRPQLMASNLGEGQTPEQVVNFPRRETTTEGPTTGTEGGFTPVGKFAPKEGAPEDAFRRRVQEKMDIYSEFLGADPEARKAQALFLLAEAALNVAGATGRSTAERLSKGLKGFPAGMAAIGAEAQKDKRAIAAAAVSAVEQEYADARRAAAMIAREQVRRASTPTKVTSLTSSLLARDPNMNPDVARQLATDMDNGTVAQDRNTREWYDNITGEIRWSPYKPLGPNQVGYLDPNNPYVRTNPDQMTVTQDPETRKNLINERQKLQKNLTLYDRFMQDVYGDTVGVLPTIQSGVSRFVLGLFGDVGFGLTDVQKNQIRANQAIGNEFIKKGLFRNSDRVSNLDMKNADSLAEDPNKFFTDAPLVIGTVQNFQRADINRLAEIDAQLFGTPMRELSRIPQGSKTDPLPVGPNTEMLLRDAFTKRPNLSMHLQFPDGLVQRIDSNHPYVQQLLRGTAQ